jgi:hypothetical protein
MENGDDVFSLVCLNTYMKSVLPLFVLLSLAAVLFLGGCASTGTADNSGDPGTQVDSNGKPVSNIPWNRPTSWESGGALGSALGQ